MNRISNSVLIFCIVGLLLDTGTVSSQNVPLVCPQNYNGYVPHPLNCNLYLQCANGQPPVVNSCGPGKVYNRVQIRCDILANVPECQGVPQVAPGNQWNQQQPAWQQPNNNQQWNQPGWQQQQQQPGWQQPAVPNQQWNPQQQQPGWQQPAVPNQQWNQGVRPPVINGNQGPLRSVNNANQQGPVIPPVNNGNQASSDADC